MKTKLITCVSTLENEGLKKLEYSLKHFGYDYHIIVDPTIGWDWGGWRNVYEYCKKLKAETDYTHVIWTDGFDTLALAPPAEAEQAFKNICGDDLNKFVYSVEKNFFPHEEPHGEVTPYWDKLFSNEALGLTDNHRWRYVNGGQYMGSLDRVIEWYENAPKELNNQYWANKYFTKLNDGRLKLDFNCELFQSVAFSGKDHGAEDEFSLLPLSTTWSPAGEPERKVDRKLYNNYTKSYPCFAHANGMKGEDFKKNFQFVYDILSL